MNATIEKQKAQKEGQDVLHLTLIKPLGSIEVLDI